ncbi:MAG: AAA family ATPase [Acidobacteriia bacterium]|nr:AAA family ATPase [Terriglobia bacterium]
MTREIKQPADLAVLEESLRKSGRLNGSPDLGAVLVLPRLLTAAELYKTETREQRALVPGLFYDGLTILAARPKDGKSWLALQLSIAIAGGRSLDGVDVCETGTVLFGALEDPEIRTANRLRKLAAPGPWLENITFFYQLLPLMGGGGEQLRELIKKVQPRVVVLDTLTALVKASKRESDVFRTQYEEVTCLRQICTDARVAALLVHHTRKGIAAGPIEAVAGTGGVTAAADAIWVLSRKPEGVATLDVTGREVEERSFALHFNRDEPFGWQVRGDGQDLAMSTERSSVIDLLREEGAMSPRQISAELGKSREGVRQMLRRMVSDGQLRREGRKYTL